MSKLMQSICLAAMLVVNPLLSQADDALLKERLRTVYDRSASAQARSAAAKSLGEMGDPRAIEPLIMLLANLSDTDPLFETSLNKAIEELEPLGHVLEKLKDSSAEVRARACLMLLVLGDPDSADALIVALKDPSPEVRREATFALSRLGLAKSAAGLIAALNGDKVYYVRMAAARALGNVGTPEAKHALEHAEKTESDAFVRGAIRRSLTVIARGNKP